MILLILYLRQKIIQALAAIQNVILVFGLSFLDKMIFMKICQHSIDTIKFSEYKIFFLLTSGIVTNDIKITEITMLTQNIHLKNMKYEATTEPKCDSISFIFSSHGINHMDKLAISRFQCCHF